VLWILPRVRNHFINNDKLSQSYFLCMLADVNNLSVIVLDSYYLSFFIVFSFIVCFVLLSYFESATTLSLMTLNITTLSIALSINDIQHGTLGIEWHYAECCGIDTTTFSISTLRIPILSITTASIAIKRPTLNIIDLIVAISIIDIQQKATQHKFLMPSWWVSNTDAYTGRTVSIYGQSLYCERMSSWLNIAHAYIRKNRRIYAFVENDYFTKCFRYKNHRTYPYIAILLTQ
jgi:hypothetical protein